MRAKPKGVKGRNLIARKGVIYFVKVVNGKRISESLKTADWNEAAAARDLIEAKLGTRPRISGKVPTFADMAETYLKRIDAFGLKETTKEDRSRLLRPDKPIVQRFGPLQLDDIRRRDLLDWWDEDVLGGGSSIATASNYLDAIASVFKVAVDLEEIDANPIAALRDTLRSRNRTSEARTAASTPDVHPIEDLAHLAAFVQASEAAGGPGHILDLLCLDAGLRLGEAQALHWEDIWFGRDADDKTRSLRIRRSLSRGTHLTTPKNGLERKVDLSRKAAVCAPGLADEAGETGIGKGHRARFCELSETPFRADLQEIGDRALQPEGLAGHLRLPAHHGRRQGHLREHPIGPRSWPWQHRIDREALRPISSPRRLPESDSGGGR